MRRQDNTRAELPLTRWSAAPVLFGLAVGMLAGQLIGIERRVDETHISSVGFGIEQTALRAWYAHHITESGEDYSIHTSNGDSIIDAPHG